VGEDEKLSSGLDPSDQTATATRGNSSLFADRRFLAVAAVIVVIISFVIIFLFRGAPQNSAMRYVAIETASNLTREQVALIRAELRYVNIPSRATGSGKNWTVFVPIKHKDKALDRLALRGLPAGAVKGFRLFDEKEGLGSTDFDKRVKYVRALNGELSLVISMLDYVEDARVQIVLPEKQLFTQKKSKVTASVLLQLKRGHKLKADQIQGIVQLVASSVENLTPDNVTVVNTDGYVLHGATIPFLQHEKSLDMTSVSKYNNALIEDQWKNTQKKDIDHLAVTEEKTGINDTNKTKEKTLEDKIYVQLKYKKDLEKTLERKAQKVLDYYFPKNSSLIKVDISLNPISNENLDVDLTKLEKISAIILLSEGVSINLTSKLKQDVFHAVASAIGYRYGSKDRIDLKRVPFDFKKNNNAFLSFNWLKDSSLWPVLVGKVKEIESYIGFSGLIALGVSIFVLLLIIFILIRIRRKRSREKSSFSISEESKFAIGDGSIADDQDLLNISGVEEIRDIARSDPDKVSSLIVEWFNG